MVIVRIIEATGMESETTQKPITGANRRNDDKVFAE